MLFLTNAGKWEETKTKVRGVCVCVCPRYGRQLSDFLTEKLSDAAWLPRGDHGLAGSNETAGSPPFIVLHGCCDFYKLKANPSTSKKDYNSLCHDNCFIEGFWIGTCSVRGASISLTVDAQVIRCRLGGR